MSVLSDNDDVQSSIKRWVSADIRAMQAYHVPSAETLLKLDAMENPYSLSDSLKGEWLRCLDTVQINRYPDADCRELKTVIRDCFAIPEALGLMLGNGSDELIQIIAMLMGGTGRTFLAPIPSFSMYPQISTATATQFVGIPLNADCSLDAETLFAAIATHNPACVFLAYPNNPTGNCFDPTIIRQVLNRVQGLVIVDEAYFAFSQKTFLTEIDTHPNLLVLRTLSKSGLAGLRLGMMIGNSQWIEQMEKLRLPYNINSLTQASARFYVQHDAVFQQQVEQIRKDQHWVFQALSNIPGITVFPSETNFLFFRVKQSQTLFEGLRKQGILIKNLDQQPLQQSPQTRANHCPDNYMRVTIGTKDENKTFIDALRSLLAN